MKKDLIFFSIVIPLYNKSNYIQKTINSVLQQTYPHFELIIVDDGSTDSSADVVRSISDERILLYTQENGGVSKARNFGVNKANADWVAFLDADDEYLPDFLNQIACFIKKHGDDDLSMIGTNYYYGEQLTPMLNTTITSRVYDYFELFGDQRSPNNSSTTVVNKLKFLEVNGFPEGIKQFEDWITWFKLAFTGSFGFISTPLGIYHVIYESASTTKRAAIDFFNDAILVPNTIAEGIEKYSLSSESETNAWGCSNEFVVNIAGMLAYDGYKTLAFKMLTLFCIKRFSVKRAGRLKLLLLYLILPQWLKLLILRYKHKKTMPVLL
jgi:glycosyltransferase involved in cell wall biosynthesis